MRSSRYVLGLVLTTLWLSPAAAEEIDNAREYRACMAEVDADPTAAFERATSWIGLGGGEAARHCQAAALIGLTEYAEAATRLEDLAATSKRAPEIRVGMLAQAGQAWLLAGEPERAYAVATTAIGLTPNDPTVYRDRAMAAAEAMNYADALADLSRAIELDPEWADAYALRASAKRYLDDLDGALDDVRRALHLAPGHQGAWLEKGIVHRLKNDPDAARQAWQEVLRVDPNTAAADLARRNLERLDVAKER